MRIGKLLILALLLLDVGALYAATITWEPWVVNSTIRGVDTLGYGLSVSVQEDFRNLVYMEGELIGLPTEEGLYLKSLDYATTPTPRSNTYLAIASFGDLFALDTLSSFVELPICDFNTLDARTGGLLVEDRADFYMVFVTPEDSIYNEDQFLGWLHLSVNDAGRMTILDADISLDCQPMIVGGAIPEPSPGVLLLFGLAGLGLRRKKFVA